MRGRAGSRREGGRVYVFYAALSVSLPKVYPFKSNTFHVRDENSRALPKKQSAPLFFTPPRRF